MHICTRNLCKNYKAARRIGTKIYRDGVKWCDTCAMFISWEGRICPCCGRTLRSRPRSRKYRELRVVQRIG